MRVESPTSARQESSIVQLVQREHSCEHYRTAAIHEITLQTFTYCHLWLYHETTCTKFPLECK